MRKNPTSARKKGDVYQELWGIKLCGDWLLNPHIYQWLQFELIPEETEQKDFYLDDIVALKENGNYDLYQTKHKQDRKNSWSWNEFTSPLPNQKNSLLKKWACSLFRTTDKTGYEFYNKTDSVAFITNADASQEISKYLKNESVDIELLKKSDAELYKSIEKEIGDNKKTKLFFKKFKFKFSQKNQDDFEEDIRKFFYEILCVTKAGFDNFLKWIRDKAQEQVTIKLEFEDIRRECEFDNPQALNEDFIIPEDFEFFDNQVHKKITEDLKESEGGVKVIYGEPGAGKSVYLSQLDKQLNESGVISVKHHYHISPEDTNPSDRLNADRVIEAIKAQFKTHKEELDELANVNSKNTSLGKFISKIADKSVKKDKAFVIIIDGLDHPLKYQAEEELKALLSEVCLPQKGVWIVIGMQLIAKPYLPPAIIEKCPEQEWVEIKGLGEDSVLNVLKRNLVALKLPTEDRQLKSLLSKVYQITQGNPLHLRYTLQQLKNLNGNTLVTEYSCENLIAYGGNIEKYYDSLWRQISDVAKNLLLTIASVNFLFTEKQLIECVSQTISNPTDVTKGFNLIAHLISVNYRQQLSVYHNSFEVYLRKRPEYEQQKLIIRKNIKTWLASSSNDYLKWAELKLIEQDLGNSTPLLEINKNWLVEAICNSSNPSQISPQIEQASKVAIEQGNFARALNLSYLHNYFTNLNINSEESKESIWQESFYHNSDLFSFINFDEVPTSALSKLAFIAEAKGESSSIEAIINELKKRLDNQEYRRDSVPAATRAVLEVISLDRTYSAKRIYEYIIKFRYLKVSSTLFKIYSASLLSLDQIQKIKDLLKLAFLDDEKQVILTECAKYGFENKSEDLSDLFKGEPDLSLTALLYLRMKGLPGSQKLPDLPPYKDFPVTLEEYDSAKRASLRNFYRDNFLNGILYTLANRAKEIEEWISNAPDSWATSAMKSLFQASILIGSGIPESLINYEDLFSPLKDIQQLSWPEDRDSLSIQHGFSDSLTIIFKDLSLIKELLNDQRLITTQGFTFITGQPFLFNEDTLLDIALQSERLILDNDVYKKIKDSNIEGLENSITTFPDRAGGYVKISELVRLYEDEENSLPFLRKAADNLLGHGYHKDTYLFDLIEAIGFCADAGISESKIANWISRVTPLIEYVGEYTDGDETNHLPYELAELLSKQSKNLLYKYLFWSTKKEDLYHAEKLYKILISSFTYSDEMEVSLASTTLDRESFIILKKQTQDNLGAKKALENIEKYFGKIDYPPDNESSSSAYTPPIIDYSSVGPNDVLTYLDSNFDNKWQLIDYLKGWTQYWVTRHDRKEIYELNKKFLEKYGVQNISGEHLDIIIPLAQEFDNSASFSLLCNAQINDRGWQRYWTDKKKAERRWEIIRTQFSQRFLEFFQKTIGGGIPLSRGAEYFALFKDLKNAENITEAGVGFAEELMADLKFPVVDWQNDKSEIYLIDLLLQRLLWPSTLTQERSATTIAELLIKSENKKKIFKKLLSWIEDQKMESTVAIGLLPILKAIYLASNLSDVSFINYKDIINSIKVNSVVVERLVDELAGLLKVRSLPLSAYREVQIPLTDYSPSKFFLRHISTFVAPIYMDRAARIEALTKKSFVKYWSLAFDSIVEETATVLDANQVYFYGRSERDDFMLGFSSKVGQVYRSAFLRVLAAFYKQGYIKRDRYLQCSYATLPIDLSYWKILPNKSPSWWPELNEASPPEADTFATLSFKNTPDSLAKTIEGNYILAAEGAIKPGLDWQKTLPMHSFSLLGFAYKVIGGTLPAPEEVAEELLYGQRIARVPSETTKPFHFLEDQSNFLFTEESIKIKDLIIYPLIARERHLCIGLWQYFRDHEISINLTENATKDLKLKIGKSSWTYKSSRGRKIAEYKDWLSGLRERYDPMLPIHHGQHLSCNKEWLDAWLKKKSLRLGYILKSTFRAKKYSYDKAQEFSETKFINLSSLIIP